MKRDPIGFRRARCATAAMLFALLATGAGAQTLSDPYPRPNPHPAAGKPTAAKNQSLHMKACPEFGAGFYRVDGTDACVKIGGFIDAGVGARH